MIDRGVALLLIGAALGVVSSLIGALVQHLLSLRADKIRRERDRKEEERREMLQAARMMLRRGGPKPATLDEEFLVRNIANRFQSLLTRLESFEEAEKTREEEGTQGEASETR